MKWTVEATHAGTGEELVLGLEAGTGDQAASLAAAAGLHVRDCYPASRRWYKVGRTLAWVWCWYSGLMVVATLGIAVVRNSLEPLAGSLCGLVLAVPGLLLARAMTRALHREPRSDPRHGFDVVVQPPASPRLPSARPDPLDDDRETPVRRGGI